MSSMWLFGVFLNHRFVEVWNCRRRMNISPWDRHDLPTVKNPVVNSKKIGTTAIPSILKVFFWVLICNIWHIHTHDRHSLFYYLWCLNASSQSQSLIFSAHNLLVINKTSVVTVRVVRKPKGQAVQFMKRVQIQVGNIHVYWQHCIATIWMGLRCNDYLEQMQTSFSTCNYFGMVQILCR